MTIEKSTDDQNLELQKLIDSCPYFNQSEYEYKNFSVSTGISYPRFIIQTINRIRKISSDLETETRTFEKKCLEEEKAFLEKYLQEQDLENLEMLVETWQDSEQEYWVNQLGKVAALEILTLGKVSLETMNQLVKLPEDAYITATQICVKLANAVKQATVNAEEAIGVYAPDETEPSNGPRKLMLRKVK